jgi:hypothetical protein
LVAEDLDITGAERRSRVVSIIVGLIPLTGALAAILALLWRKYLAHIGVRPVDLAIDPATRLADTVAAALLFLGVFGPLLFISHWLDLASEGAADHRTLASVARHRKGSGLILALAWLPVASVLTVIADLVLILIVGPVVAVSILAWAVDASDMLPTMLQIDGLKPRRVLTGTLVALVLILTILSIEVLVVGPDLQPDGAHGVLAPKILGFRAQPMQAFDVDGARESREILYLGGNADLYVLVNPCEDDTVEFVSVGSTRLVVIDEVSCEP